MQSILNGRPSPLLKHYFRFLIEQLTTTHNLDELLDVGPDVAANILDGVELGLGPGADLVEDAVVVERFGDVTATGDQLDGTAQDVARAAVDAGLGDRVEADDHGEHREAGNRVGLV